MPPNVTRRSRRPPLNSAPAIRCRSSTSTAVRFVVLTDPVGFVMRRALDLLIILAIVLNLLCMSVRRETKEPKGRLGPSVSVDRKQ
jgi:hypothetical protein